MVAAIISVIVWIALFVIAHFDNAVSRIVRTIWNFIFMFTAVIPFCGWMTIFYVAVTPEEKIKKAKLRGKGVQTDDKAWADLEARNQRAALLSELQSQAYEKLGTRDIELSEDCTKVKLSNGDWLTLSEFNDVLSGDRRL